MKKIFLASVYLFFIAFIFNRCSFESKAADRISFYKVPLACGAALDIGCGSRIKPLFLDTEKEKGIKESWTNHQGTVIAIVWNTQVNEELMQSLFTKNNIEAIHVNDSEEFKRFFADFREKKKWLEGMNVDQLSFEEAGVMAATLTQFAEDAKLISHKECMSIRKDLEEYFKKELVMVRTESELKSPEVRAKWIHSSYDIYVNHVGKQRADAISKFYVELKGIKE